MEKPTEVTLDSVIAKIKDDYGSDWNIPVRVLFSRILDDHWEEVKDELRNCERLIDVATWPETIELVEEITEKEWDWEDALELFKRQLQKTPHDYELFKREILTDPLKALTLRN